MLKPNKVQATNIVLASNYGATVKTEVEDKIENAIAPVIEDLAKEYKRDIKVSLTINID